MTGARSGTGRRRVVVVGGGVSGLTAGYRLAATGRWSVTVLEGGGVTGGKLAVGEVGGLPVDLGAEAMLARRPEAVELAREVGLGDDLVDPGTTTAGVYARDALRRFPRPMVSGVPADLTDLARTGIVSPLEVARAATDVVRPSTPVAGDVSVGQYVRERLGAAVVDRLVEPVLGGVYAGRADELSFRACLPQLADALDGRSLVRVAQASSARQSAGPSGPVFAGLRGGVGRLAGGVRTVAERAGARVRTGVTVRELTATSSGWRLECGPTRAPEVVHADAVLLACPPAPAARLLRDVAPFAALDLTGIPTASMAIVTLVLGRAELPGSGFLAGAGQLATVKGGTWSSTKWPWLGELAGGRAGRATVVARASVGRRGDEALLQRPDDELVALARTDLDRVLAGDGGAGVVVDSQVTRWGGGLPQYTVGHRERVARIRREVARYPSLAIAGAALDGIGIPACIATATTAAAELTDRVLGPATEGAPGTMTA